MRITLSKLCLHNNNCGIATENIYDILWVKYKASDTPSYKVHGFNFVCCSAWTNFVPPDMIYILFENTILTENYSAKSNFPPKESLQDTL